MTTTFPRMRGRLERRIAAIMLIVGGVATCYLFVCALNLVIMRLATGRWHVPDSRIHAIDMVTSFSVWVLLMSTACFAAVKGYRILKRPATTAPTQP